MFVEYSRVVDSVYDACRRYLAELTMFDKGGKIFPVAELAKLADSARPVWAAEPASPLAAAATNFNNFFAEARAADTIVDMLDNQANWLELKHLASQTRVETIELYRRPTITAWRQEQRRRPVLTHQLLSRLLPTDPPLSEVATQIAENRGPFVLALAAKYASQMDPALRKASITVIDERIKQLFGEGPPQPVYLARGPPAASPSVPWDKLTIEGLPDGPDAANSPGRSVCLEQYSAGTALEFDADCLLAPAPNTETTGYCGLSKRVLARYATVKALPGGQKSYTMRVIPGAQPGYTRIESISPGLWREVPGATLPATSVRPALYNRLPPDLFRPNHAQILARIAERQVHSPDATYDLLANQLVSAFPHVNSPAEFIAAATLLESAVYAKFRHVDTLGLRRESMVSYLLKLEPTLLTLLGPELSLQLAKYAPAGQLFTELAGHALQNHLRGLFEQAVRAAVDTAKQAKWLDDYDETYKLCYLKHL